MNIITCWGLLCIIIIIIIIIIINKSIIVTSLVLYVWAAGGPYLHDNSLDKQWTIKSKCFILSTFATYI